MTKHSLLPNKALSERGMLILTAAQKLFLANGFDDTSLEMIINESGGSRRAIYKEFGNKEGLLLAVVQHQIAMQTKLLKSIDQQAPVELVLKSICQSFLQGMLSDTMVGLLRLVTHSVLKMPKVGELVYQQGPMSGTKPLAEYLAFLHKTKQLKVEDSIFSAQLLIEMLKGHLHLRAILVPKDKISPQEIEQQVNKVVDFFLAAHKR